jgi:pilus assembly protein CpaB
MMQDWGAATQWRALRRAIAWHRRLLAAGLAAGAVAFTISAVQPPAPPTVSVLVAAHDLGGGTYLRRGDVTTVHLPHRLVPAGALRPGTGAAGLTLAAPMRRGETLTDARIIGPGLLVGPSFVGQRLTEQPPTGRPSGDRPLAARPHPVAEVVAVPVRLADAEAARLVRAGDRVDVLAADARPESTASDERARTVASGVRVLAVPRPDNDHGFGAPQVSEGALVVLATTADVAGLLARAAVTARLSVTIRAS